MMGKIREICGPFNHHGHVVADIQETMDNYLSIGIGPWFFITKDRLDRWEAQARSGGGKKGKLRGTQLHYGEPTAYRALVAFGFNADTAIELVQPYNDEPSCHNDWLKKHGNGLQHINFTVPREHYVQLIGECIDAGWVPSIQLIGGDGKAGNGPPGHPNMPTVHYFDFMAEFGFHIELSCGPALEDGSYAKFKTRLAYMAHIARTWDGVTDPIRHAYPEVPDDFTPAHIDVPALSA